MSTTDSTSEHHGEGVKRRDFLFIAAGGFGAVGAAAAVWPLVDNLNPSADVLALSSIEVDISKVQVGQSIRVKWRGKPVFIRHRTEEEVAEAKDVNIQELKDPQTDAQRTKPGHEPWLIMIGVCTHLGCIPLGEQGEFGGWFCPCHGSEYDTSGRIRKGPAPLNLEVPEYAFLNDTRVRIG
ncbi:ubiquinol-cytochrome c reductase iron-sulfur subunit [Emcibacter sp. SYSU 3D8]|uniref:ubiquinol-cytochrome c reductase iron-sulfur subunit n=1 Tax=Emcibacter sp. SYSU 3D8 TaxID=3133969 RepID=UPI0031FF2219